MSTIDDRLLDEMIEAHKDGWQDKHWIAYNLLVDSGEKVYDKLPEIEQKQGSPSLIVCTGYPGAGKTTIGKRMEALHGYKMVDSDEVRRGMFPDGRSKTPVNEARVTIAINELRDHYLSHGYNTILTAGSSTEIYRETFLETKVPTANRMLLYLIASREVVKQRRGKRIFEFMDLLWEEPNTAASYMNRVKFQEIATCSLDDMDVNIRTVMAQLKN